MPSWDRLGSEYSPAFIALKTCKPHSLEEPKMPIAGEVVGKAFCSTANLGPGFDTFGLALNRYYDRVSVRVGRRGKRIIIRGKGPYGQSLPARADRNSAGAPAIELLARSGISHGLEITIEKNVPIGLGLGSSGASAAACARAVDALLELNLPDEVLVQVASLGEAAVTGSPHADNVAASLLGGFAVVFGKDPVRAVSCRPPSNLAVVVAIPEVHLPSRKTRLARSLVPGTVRVEDAVLNVARASAMALGFAKGDIGLIGGCMEDQVAEPYREKLIPGYKAVKQAALANHAAGVAISGAGPSVVALVDDEQCDPRGVGKLMIREFYRSEVSASYFVSKPASRASLTRGL